MKYDVFLSYSRADEKLARQFVEFAGRRGLSVWYDAMILQSDWRDKIVAAMREARVVVVLFSVATNRSDQLKKELAIADRMKKPLVPVMIKKAELDGSYLYELASKNWIVLHPDPAARLGELVERLKAVLAEVAAAGESVPAHAAPTVVEERAGTDKPSPEYAGGIIPFHVSDWLFGTVALLGTAATGFGFMLLGVGRKSPKDRAYLVFVVPVIVAAYLFFVRFGYRNGRSRRSFSSSYFGYLLFSLVAAFIQCAVELAILPYPAEISRSTYFFELLLEALLFVVPGVAVAMIAQARNTRP